MRVADRLAAGLRARAPKLAELVHVGGQCVDQARWAALAWMLLTQGGLDPDDRAELDRLSAELGRDTADELEARQPADAAQLVQRLLGGGQR